MIDGIAIGLKVKSLRQEMGLTTTDLAGLVGVSQAQISRLENGKQGFRSVTISKISKALGVKPIFFFMEETTSDLAAEPAEEYGFDEKVVRAMRAPMFSSLIEKQADMFFLEDGEFENVSELIEKFINSSAEKKRILLELIAIEK